MRIGQGFDVHAFGDGDHVMLGGVRVPHGRGLVAHSDGLESQWDLAAHPGALMLHPSIIAALLFRRHWRKRDDVAVVVVRRR